MRVKPKHLEKRGGVWQFLRRVPTQFAEVDPRRRVRVTTKVRVVDDPLGAKAMLVAAQLNKELEAYWTSQLEQLQPILITENTAQGTYEAAVAQCKRFGFAPLSLNHLSLGPVEEIVKRVETLIDQRDKAKDLAPALLGVTTQKPQLLLSQLYQTYIELEPEKLAAKSPEQIRMFQGSHLRAQNAFLKLVGDMDLRDITCDHTLAFREYWLEQVATTGKKKATAHRQFSDLAAMYRAVNKRRQLQMEDVFADLALGKDDTNVRRPWPVEDILKNLLAIGTLGGLTPPLQALVYIMIETGLRPSEICGLTGNNIHLDCEVPYVSIKPELRHLKTDPSSREMPLVGVALEAVKLFPQGLERYYDKNNTATTQINRYLRIHNLCSPSVSLYGLRHSFKDRLRAQKVDEEMCRWLMGHATNGSLYGEGPPLSLKREALERVAFPVPEEFQRCFSL
ncbi:tyrosine-type recombinase/integrase [Flexibacterium corallicola]|uniref:tyrosine-type recombinase/integrase n=1 Tax=Flexibacterium corallicola TaxID=3037259 RepID=UPI00286EF211|nr:tyrosine-type recombinase/integrase [Pseudovibrio sp. M1P-2-3]